MKALFLVFHGFAEHNGITKKIRSQVAALEACGVPTVLCHTAFGPGGEQLRMAGEVVVEDYGAGQMAKITKRIRWRSLYDYILGEGIGMVYMRANHNANPFLRGFLKRLRLAGVRVVMEIPTWPYDSEYRGMPVSFRSRLWVDRLFRHGMASELWRIVTFSNEERIFGVPTIRISNGIDFDAIPLKKHMSDDPAELNLIAVAEIHAWHGFDRAVAGLATYYRQPQPVRVKLNIIGPSFGGTAEALQAQVADLGMGEHVIFHGQQSGAALDALFEQADMGVASLARHRSGITHIKTLKNREYAARGIPFVYSEIDDDFERMPYVMKAPADESPLDIAAVVDFYRRTPHDPAAIRASIEGTLSWRAQMQKVIDAVQEK